MVKEKFSALGWNENTSSEEATMATVTRHEFTGQEGLDNAGLWMVNMNGRVYIPGGLFISPDPYLQDPTDTRSYNRYAYVNYNPLTDIDPTGFCDESDDNTVVVCGTPPPPPDLILPGDLIPISLPDESGFRPPMILLPQGEQKPQRGQNKQTPTVCIGVGRGLSGNTSLVGRQGGIPGQTVQPNTAAVIPQQFGVPSGAALAPYAPNINGTIGQAPFSAVTDVIGGKSPIPGVPVRTALQQLFPGQLILEIPGAPDQGANAPVTITVPPGVGCPTGTSPAPTAGGP